MSASTKEAATFAVCRHSAASDDRSYPGTSTAQPPSPPLLNKKDSTFRATNSKVGDRHTAATARTIHSLDHQAEMDHRLRQYYRDIINADLPQYLNQDVAVVFLSSTILCSALSLRRSVDLITGHTAHLYPKVGRASALRHVDPRQREEDVRSVVGSPTEITAAFSLAPPSSRIPRVYGSA